MPNADPPVAEGPPSAEEVAGRTFPTAFRGFDPVEVRSFLGRVADELRRLHEQHQSLRSELEEALTRTPAMEASNLVIAARAEAEELTATNRAEAEELASIAKADADRVVREAKDRVAALGAAATAEATRVLDDAKAQAERIQSTAGDDLRVRGEEAEATAVRRIAEAEREAAAIRVQSRTEADEVIEAARQRGRDMVGEAQAARERMLADLAKRKRAALSQLEQLKVGRDRLLDTLRVARRGIEEMTTRFEVVDGGPPATTGAERSGGHGPERGSGPERPGDLPGDRGPERPLARSTGPERAGDRTANAEGAHASTAPPRAAPVDSTPSLPVPITSSRDPSPAPTRGRGLAIGEAPVPGPRPQIAAPQAHWAQESARGSDPKGRAEPASAGQAGPTARPARTEERRSSALRILRRNRQPPPPPAVPPHVGRASAGEGVRVIRATAPEAADGLEPAIGSEDGPIEAPELTADTEMAVAKAEVSAPSEQATPEAGEARERPPEPESEPESEAPLEPLVRDSIRPRIEDLFARIRADRQAAVVPAGQGPAEPAHQMIDGPEPPPPRDAVPERRPEPGAQPVDPSVRAALASTDEQLLEARDGVVEPLAGRLTRRLKRALQDEQNACLDRLRTSRGAAPVDMLVGRPAEQAKPFIDPARHFLGEAARAGASTTRFGPSAVSVDDLAGQLANDLTVSVRTNIHGVLVAGGEEDVDVAGLSERVSAVYRGWKSKKLERLALHYLVAAHERGRFVAHPEGAPFRWIVDDEAPCPDCDDNALAGRVPRGAEYPTGQLHPPAHVGCRCLLAPDPA